MTATNQPNEYGFVGAAEPATSDAADGPQADRLVVPADDPDGSLTGGIDELTHAGDAREDDPR